MQYQLRYQDLGFSSILQDYQPFLHQLHKLKVYLDFKKSLFNLNIQQRNHKYATLKALVGILFI